MFTGIVEAVGTVEELERRGTSQRTTVRCPGILDEVRLGDSMCIDGVCQTVVAVTSDAFAFESVPETLRLTTIGSWRRGRRVNVERSLKVGARLSGHWVLGHVDGVIALLERSDAGDSAELRFSLPNELAPQVARKGSVAIDGVSLTVTGLDDRSFGIALIPFTLVHTTLGEKRVGDRLNIETDVLAKYVVRLTERTGRFGDASSGVTESLLEQAGFLGGKSSG